MKEHKSIRIEKELIDKIKIRAIKENRSFNNTLETVIVESLKSQNIEHYKNELRDKFELHRRKHAIADNFGKAQVVQDLLEDCGLYIEPEV